MFSETQQFYPQAQQLNSSPPLISQQQLVVLLPSQRLALYQCSLTQQAPIYISPDGSFSNLSLTVRDSLHLLTTSNPISKGSAQFLHNSNEIFTSISTIPVIFKTQIRHLTRLAILFGPPENPGGGSAELFPLLSLPSLTHPRLISQDRPFKDIGPILWLRICIAFILKQQDEKQISLCVQLKIGGGEELEDITQFLDLLSGSGSLVR